MPGAADLTARFPALDIVARRARLQNSLRLSPGPLAEPARTRGAEAERAAAGLWRREPAVWTRDPAVQATIANRLGWLGSAELMADALPRLSAFADGVRRNGFTDVVLLGMGGSSLAPDVLRAVVGVAPGYPRLQMLDSTDPAAVRAVATPAATTLYVLASKSGTTIEPNALAAHFAATLEREGVAHWADQFVAITDEGTDLARRARAEAFRDVFINPSDIGGRYSALSFFGMVPAALMGQNVSAIVGWGLAMLAACEPGFGQAHDHPAVTLGLAMGAGALAGRDKLTLVSPPALDRFGLWVEQLVAESTGKQGHGVVPIAGEPLAAADRYGDDRLFVVIGRNGADEDEASDTTEALGRAGHPTVTITMPEPEAIGAEFLRWEVATAIASALLEINPFDEPNVQQAKDATRVLLARHQADGALPVAAPDRVLGDGTTLTLTRAAKAALGDRGAGRFLETLEVRDYFALLAYLGPDPALADRLRALRVAVRDRTGAATMFGYGPRYLHSTGQLHKGGPNRGIFVLITAVPDVDVPIPGERFSFGTLELAQALGDFASLDAADRRALHIHLPSPDAQVLGAAVDALLAAASA